MSNLIDRIDAEIARRHVEGPPSVTGPSRGGDGAGASTRGIIAVSQQNPGFQFPLCKKKEYISLREFAKRMFVSHTAVRKAVAAGRLKTHEIGQKRPVLEWEEAKNAWNGTRTIQNNNRYGELAGDYTGGYQDDNQPPQNSQSGYQSGNRTGTSDNQGWSPHAQSGYQSDNPGFHSGCHLSPDAPHGCHLDSDGQVPDSDANWSLRYNMERSLHERAKRKKAEREVAELESRMHNAEDVKKIADHFEAAFRKSMSAMSAEITKALADITGYDDLVAIENAVESMINEGLATLSGLYDPEKIERERMKRGK